MPTCLFGVYSGISRDKLQFCLCLSPTQLRYFDSIVKIQVKNPHNYWTVILQSRINAIYLSFIQSWTFCTFLKVLTYPEVWLNSLIASCTWPKWSYVSPECCVVPSNQLSDILNEPKLFLQLAFTREGFLTWVINYHSQESFLLCLSKRSTAH